MYVIGNVLIEESCGGYREVQEELFSANFLGNERARLFFDTVRIVDCILFRSLEAVESPALDSDVKRDGLGDQVAPA